jgi:hypothetical protein
MLLIHRYNISLHFTSTPLHFTNHKYPSRYSGGRIVNIELLKAESVAYWVAR